MIIVKRAGRRRPGHVSNICGLALSFTHQIVDGQRLFCVEVADDHPKAMELQQFAAGHTSYDVLNAVAVPPAPQTPESIASPKETGPGELAAPVAAAVANGWSADDLDGAGQNDDFGPGGGFSAVTGLTMGQMAMSTPPDDWSEARATKYPWECVGWKPSWASFTPPSVAPKVPAVLESEPEPEVEPEPEAEVDEEPEPEPEPEVEPELEAEDDADEDTDPALAAGYPEADLTKARAMAHAIVEATGQIPHPNKVNYQLKKAGLQTVGKTELDALLALPI